MKREDYFQHPTRPLEMDKIRTVGDLVEAYGGTSFQSRNLHKAMRIWGRALEEESCAIFLGLSGAMVPAGMRRVVVDLIRHKFVDAIVSTGANLYHDLHEGLGGSHYMGHPHVDDEELARLDIDRVYDTYADDTAFQKLDEKLADFALNKLEARPYSTREFLQEVGREYRPKDSIVGACFEEGVPAFCPTFHDSGYGIAISRAYGLAENKGQPHLTIDLIRDNLEMVAVRQAAKVSAAIYVGGGVPKNYTQQIEPLIEVMTGKKVAGHTYAVQITTDAPHWGGLSGCTFEEAKSWDKMVDGFQGAQVFLEATVGFSLLAKAVTERFAETAGKRTRATADCFRPAAKSV